MVSGPALKHIGSSSSHVNHEMRHVIDMACLLHEHSVVSGTDLLGDGCPCRHAQFSVHKASTTHASA